MHVVVGPVPADSASAFAEFAATVLDDRGADLPVDVRTAFTGYLDEWRDLGRPGSTVTWETEVEVEVGEYLVLAFYRVAQQVDAERETADPILPPEVTPFYLALVQGLLAAMAEAGPGAAEWADHLRGFWPGGSLP